jgi:hypothetical protein
MKRATLAPMETVFIRLENPPRGMDHARMVDGRGTAKNWDRLRALAHRLNTRPLQDFIRSGTRGTWFSPNEAMDTIRKFISYVSSDKVHFEEARLLLKDLSSYENILSAAMARGSRFQFAAEFKDKEVPSKKNLPTQN